MGADIQDPLDGDDIVPPDPNDGGSLRVPPAAGDRNNYLLHRLRYQQSLEYRYFDEARDWSFSALSRYEIKTEQDDTDVTPGDSWIVEWALGKVLNNGVEVALAGYDGWQLESDSGPQTTNLFSVHSTF